MPAVDTIIDNIKTKISNRTSLKNLVPGTVAGDMTEAVSIEISNIATSAIEMSEKNNIATATASDLDRIGEFFGNTRLPSVTPIITSSMKTLKFYVDTSSNANFGAINSGADITVTKGTVIEGSSDTSIYRFVLETDLILPISGTEVFFGARLIQGINTVIPANILNIHDFKAYSDVANNSLKITNSFVVGSGRLQEKDENFRTRLKYSQKAFPKTNSAAISDFINSIPGVASVIVDNTQATGGTLNIYVQSVSPYTSDEIIANVETAMRDFINPWCSYNILRPNYIGVKASFTFSISGTGQYQNNISFAKLVSEALGRYINNYQQSTFNFNYLISEAQSLGYGITGGTLISASIFVGEDVAREERVFDITGGQTSFFISSTEKMVVEPIANAISVSFV